MSATSRQPEEGWQAYAVRLLSPELLTTAASERRLSAQRAAAATAYAVATILGFRVFRV